MDRMEQIDREIKELQKKRSLTVNEVNKAEICRQMEILAKEKIALQNSKEDKVEEKKDIKKPEIKVEEKTVNGVVPAVEKEEPKKEETPINNKKNFYKNNNFQKKEDDNDVK